MQEYSPTQTTFTSFVAPAICGSCVASADLETKQSNNFPQEFVSISPFKNSCQLQRFLCHSIKVFFSC